MSGRGPRFEYEIGEHVLCFEPDLTKARVLYDAKVVDSLMVKEPSGKKRANYVVHFQGWNSSWDRQVADHFVLRNTEENRDLMRKVADTAKRLRNGARRRKINTILHQAFGGSPPEFDDPTDSNDSDESDSGNGRSKQKGKAAMDKKKQKSNTYECEIPEVLKGYLEDDYYLIHKKNKLTRVPAKPCVVDILESFMKTFCVNFVCDPTGGREKTRNSNKHTLKCSPDKCVSLCKEFVDSLRIIFDFTLPMVLLYAAEQNQYEAAIVSVKSDNLDAVDNDSAEGPPPTKISRQTSSSSGSSSRLSKLRTSESSTTTTSTSCYKEEEKVQQLQLHPHSHNQHQHFQHHNNDNEQQQQNKNNAANPSSQSPTRSISASSISNCSSSSAPATSPPPPPRRITRQNIHQALANQDNNHQQSSSNSNSKSSTSLTASPACNNNNNNNNNNTKSSSSFSNTNNNNTHTHTKQSRSSTSLSLSMSASNNSNTTITSKDDNMLPCSSKSATTLMSSSSSSLSAVEKDNNHHQHYHYRLDGRQSLSSSGKNDDNDNENDNPLIIPIASRTRRRTHLDLDEVFVTMPTTTTTPPYASGSLTSVVATTTMHGLVQVKREPGLVEDIEVDSEVFLSKAIGPTDDQSEYTVYNGQPSSTSATTTTTTGTDSLDAMSSVHGREDAMEKILGWHMVPMEVKMNNPVTPSQIYGTPHLLRMFVKLPDVLRKMKLKDVHLQIISKFVHHCLQYMVNHQSELFHSQSYIKA